MLSPPHHLFQAEAPDAEEGAKDPDPMAYGRAGKGDEQGQERLVEELQEREEGAFSWVVCFAFMDGWASGGVG